MAMKPYIWIGGSEEGKKKMETSEETEEPFIFSSTPH